MNPNREQLLDFLLDALDDVEREQVERQLQTDPSLQQELDLLQERLEPLAECYCEYDPPATLAERTCAFVTGHANAEKARLAKVGLSEATGVGSVRSRLTLADTLVAAGILLAAALLFFPAILNSRDLARLAQCQNNLSHLGLALASYSDLGSGGFYPCVPTAGNRAFAGIYAPILQDAGFLTDPNWIVCPSSALAEQLGDFRVPTLGDVDRADRVALIVFQGMAGGSYGYNLGFVIDGKHGWPRHLGRTHFALMSDAPNPSWMDMRSLNHGGRGQNILYDDGHVRFVVDCFGTRRDHPFRNHFGRIEAGVNENDSVIGAGFSTPFPRAQPMVLNVNF